MTVTRTHNILLIIIIIASVSPLDYFFDVFSVPLPSIPTDASHLVILCLVIYAVDLQILSRFSKPVVYPSFFYIGLILAIWTTLEFIHGFNSGDLSRNLIQSFFWFGLFHQMMRSHLQVSAVLNMDQRELLKKASLYIILGLAIIHLLLCKLSDYELFGGYINKDQLYGRNSLSYLSLLGVFLLLFYPPNKGLFTEKFFVPFGLGIFGLVTLTNNTRSAILIFFVLISIKCFLLIWKYNKHLFVCTVIITIAITGILFPSMIKEKIKEFSFGLDPELMIGQDQLLEQPGPKVSTYVRNRTNLLCFLSFLQNPIIGTGFAKVKKQLTVAGYWCHTFYLLPLTAYGLIGFFPFFFFFLFEIRQGWKKCSWATIAFCACILGTWTFTNDLYTWYTIPLNIFWLEAIRKSERNMVGADGRSSVAEPRGLNLAVK